MPRAPNPQAAEAQKLYQEGHRLNEIAALLQVPEGTVRRWKSTYHWGNERSDTSSERSDSKSERSEKKVGARNRGGAPPGNQNAKGNPGGGAPMGNENALKHGIYRRRLWRSLTKEDIEALEDIPTDEETLLLYQLKSLTMQEIDCMDAIARYQHTANGIAMKTVQKETKGSGDNREEKTFSIFGNTMETILRLEKELTSIQTAKTRCIVALNDIRNTRKMNGTSEASEEEVVTMYSMPSNGRDNG